MSDLLQCTVIHQGVPIGTVDLEMLGAQGLGTLTPLPAYQSIRWRILFAGALGREARVELLTRQADAVPSHPVIAKAALPFELLDWRGATVPANVVRLVELRTRPGVTVLVDFRAEGVGELASIAPPPAALADAIPPVRIDESTPARGMVDHPSSQRDV